jgi:hypothetical protein
MPLPVWIALLAVLVSLTAGATYVFLRLLGLWRTLKRFNSALEPVAEELNGPLERLAANSEAFGSDAPRLEASLERLRRSLARAAVLGAALDDARDAFGRLAAVYPRK